MLEIAKYVEYSTVGWQIALFALNVDHSSMAREAFLPSLASANSDWRSSCYSMGVSGVFELHGSIVGSCGDVEIQMDTSKLLAAVGRTVAHASLIGALMGHDDLAAGREISDLTNEEVDFAVFFLKMDDVQFQTRLVTGLANCPNISMHHQALILPLKDLALKTDESTQLVEIGSKHYDLETQILKTISVIISRRTTISNPGIIYGPALTALRAIMCSDKELSRVNPDFWMHKLSDDEKTALALATWHFGTLENPDLSDPGFQELVNFMSQHSLNICEDIWEGPGHKRSWTEIQTLADFRSTIDNVKEKLKTAHTGEGMDKML
ncbi:hypothetical protein AJ80_09965 [Polytolypa hystricis UAMH7299]|uniref:Uncharacterized protein n=1 Tax=Polytolypa hystricis (strain UAMH7299) TaxID=1447883 RepID=A0A2B7WFF0_POLH7|nr:hypothetical protein AJ80_09965 [Polytolypa hystricis UAMH7299]